MSNEIKEKRSKDKFLEMREQEQSIQDNPIRYGREQFFKGKMAAYDRIEKTIAEWRDGLEESDTTMHHVYSHMEKLISLIRKTES